MAVAAEIGVFQVLVQLVCDSLQLPAAADGEGRLSLSVTLSLHSSVGTLAVLCSTFHSCLPSLLWLTPLCSHFGNSQLWTESSRLGTDCGSREAAAMCDT